MQEILSIGSSFVIDLRFNIRFPTNKTRAFRQTAAAVGELQHSPTLREFIAAALACLFVTFALSTTPAYGQSISTGPLERCVAVGVGRVCRPVSIEAIDLAGPVDHLRQTVMVPQAALASRLPLAVTLVGTMSAEVFWNGRLLGRNGSIGPDAAREKPGQFRATIPVPIQLVRAGQNVVEISMSAHHRWLPVRTPVQLIGIGYYEGGSARELAAYWPALVTAGALLLAMLYFGVAAAVGRGRPDALILAAVAASASLQLAIETSRSFIDYAYPWHVVRLASIVALVAVTCALMCAYAARRFVARWTMAALGLSVATSILAINMVPWFDVKAWVCLCIASLICLACAGSAAQRNLDGRIGSAAATLFTGILLVWREDALDRGYYLFLAGLFAVLVAEQVIRMRRVYTGYETERERSTDLQARLATAGEASRSIVSIRDGSVIHRYPEDEIVQVTAADDFCEVRLTSRSPLLVGWTMSAMAESLSDRFLRVHKSYIVNLVHVTAMSPKPGGGHQLILDDGSVTPVGRTYRDAVAGRLAR